VISTGACACCVQAVKARMENRVTIESFRIGKPF
jgi:hypothetical protein